MELRSTFFVICVSLALFSCTKERISGAGSTITESRNTGDFSSVSASGNTPVHVIQGASFKVEVRGYGNLLPYYETRVLNATLHVGYQPNVNIRNDNAEVFITLPVLKGLSLTGSGKIMTTGNFARNSDFNIAVYGSGNIHFSSGSSLNLFSSVDGSGSIHMLNMVAARANTGISGSGKIEITATDQLNVRINGSGKVVYRGSPVVTSHITGSGTVSPE